MFQSLTRDAKPSNTSPTNRPGQSSKCFNRSLATPSPPTVAMSVRPQGKHGFQSLTRDAKPSNTISGGPTGGTFTLFQSLTRDAKPSNTDALSFAKELTARFQSLTRDAKPSNERRWRLALHDRGVSIAHSRRQALQPLPWHPSQPTSLLFQSLTRDAKPSNQNIPLLQRRRG